MWSNVFINIYLLLYKIYCLLWIEIWDFFNNTVFIREYICIINKNMKISWMFKLSISQEDPPPKKKYCHECNEYLVFGGITCPKVVRAMEKRLSSLITLGPVEPTGIDKLCPGLHCRRCPLQSFRVGEVESWGTQTSEDKKSVPTHEPEGIMLIAVTGVDASGCWSDAAHRQTVSRTGLAMWMWLCINVYVNCVEVRRNCLGHVCCRFPPIQNLFTLVQIFTPEHRYTLLLWPAASSASTSVGNGVGGFTLSVSGDAGVFASCTNMTNNHASSRCVCVCVCVCTCVSVLHWSTEIWERPQQSARTESARFLGASVAEMLRCHILRMRWFVTWYKHGQ